MAKNNYGKLIAFTTAVAAIGGVCYVFRNKIKASPLFKSASELANEICGTVKSKVHTDDDFFFDDWDDDFNEASDNNNLSASKDSGTREYTSLAHSNNTSVQSADTDNPNKADEKKSLDETLDTSKDASQKSNEKANDIQSESIPTIDFPSNTPKSDAKSPEKYENENLSDASEDPDVLEEQDKLDF